MKRFVMSDVHGNYLGMKQCLEKSGFDYENDLLIFNGDMCDGFPHVNKCIDEILKIKNCYATIGNHDAWTMEWIKSDFTWKVPLWTRQGGQGTIDSYKDYPNGHMPKEHIDFIVNMRKYISFGEGDDEVVFIHGGLDPNQRDMDKQDVETLMWDRDLMRSAWTKNQRNPKFRFAGKEKIFIGHTSTEFYHSLEPLFLCNVVCGDTGGGMTGKISIINIDTLEYWQSDLAPKLYPDFKPRY